MKHCLALDLKNDAALIAEYDEWHRNVWPEIKKSISDSGIRQMEIYRTANRLIMFIDADDTFSFEKKAAMDEGNAKVQEWEKLMWKFQQPLPHAKPGQKWIVCEKVFSLTGE